MLPNIAGEINESRMPVKAQKIFFPINGSLLLGCSSILLWHVYQVHDTQRRATCQRRLVLSHLGKITGRLEDEYEFHGPVFVQQYVVTRSWTFGEKKKRTDVVNWDRPLQEFKLR